MDFSLPHMAFHTFPNVVRPSIDSQDKGSGPTIASSEQEAASTLGSILEPDSRCLLSLTQAFDATAHTPASELPHLGSTRRPEEGES